MLIAPQVVQLRDKVERQLTFEIQTKAKVISLMSASSKASYTALGDNSYRIVCDINDTVFLLYRKAEAALFTDLTQENFVSSWESDNGEVSAPQQGIEPKVMVAEVKYELLNGVQARPPANGRCAVQYLGSPSPPAR